MRRKKKKKKMMMNGDDGEVVEIVKETIRALVYFTLGLVC